MTGSPKSTDHPTRNKVVRFSIPEDAMDNVFHDEAMDGISYQLLVDLYREGRNAARYLVGRPYNYLRLGRYILTWRDEGGSILFTLYRTNDPSRFVALLHGMRQEDADEDYTIEHGTVVPLVEAEA